MYPTLTSRAGPAKARFCRQNPADGVGTCTVEWRSSSDRGGGGGGKGAVAAVVDVAIVSPARPSDCEVSVSLLMAALVVRIGASLMPARRPLPRPFSISHLRYLD